MQNNRHSSRYDDSPHQTQRHHRSRISKDIKPEDEHSRRGSGDDQCESESRCNESESRCHFYSDVDSEPIEHKLEKIEAEIKKAIWKNEIKPENNVSLETNRNSDRQKLTSSRGRGKRRENKTPTQVYQPPGRRKSPDTDRSSHVEENQINLSQQKVLLEQTHNSLSKDSEDVHKTHMDTLLPHCYENTPSSLDTEIMSQSHTDAIDAEPSSTEQNYSAHTISELVSNEQTSTHKYQSNDLDQLSLPGASNSLTEENVVKQCALDSKELSSSSRKDTSEKVPDLIPEDKNGPVLKKLKTVATESIDSKSHEVVCHIEKSEYFDSSNLTDTPQTSTNVDSSDKCSKVDIPEIDILPLDNEEETLASSSQNNTLGPHTIGDACDTKNMLNPRVIAVQEIEGQMNVDSDSGTENTSEFVDAVSEMDQDTDYFDTSPMKDKKETEAREDILRNIIFEDSPVSENISKDHSKLEENLVEKDVYLEGDTNEQSSVPEPHVQEKEKLKTGNDSTGSEYKLVDMETNDVWVEKKVKKEKKDKTKKSGLKKKRERKTEGIDIGLIEYKTKYELIVVIFK